MQQQFVEAVYKDHLVHPGGFRRGWDGSWRIMDCRPAWQCPEVVIEQRCQGSGVNECRVATATVLLADVKLTEGLLDIRIE